MNSWIFKLCVCVCVRVCVYTYKYMLGQLCSTLRDTMDCSSPGSSLHRDSPGNCSGLPCPLPWYLPNLGIEPRSLTVQWILYHLSHRGSQRILAWVAYPFLIGFSNPGIKLEPPALQVDALPAELQESPIYTNMKWSEVKPLSRAWLFATQWIIACQALPSMGLSRQEFWSGLPFPSSGDLPNSGIKPGSSTLQADSLPSELHIYSSI